MTILLWYFPYYLSFLTIYHFYRHIRNDAIALACT